MFGKSRFRDGNGEIDLSRIERRVNESFSLAQKFNMKCVNRIKNVLLSEAVKIVEYYKTGKRREMYDTELINELSVGSGFCNRDKHSYTVEIIPKNSVKHI